MIYCTEKEGFISSENVYKKLNINEAELDDTDVEIE